MIMPLLFEGSRILQFGHNEWWEWWVCLFEQSNHTCK